MAPVEIFSDGFEQSESTYIVEAACTTQSVKV